VVSELSGCLGHGVLEQKAAALLQIAGLRREKASEIKTKCGGIFPRVGLQRLTVNSQSASLDIIVDTVELLKGMLDQGSPRFAARAFRARSAARLRTTWCS